MVSARGTVIFLLLLLLLAFICMFGFPSAMVPIWNKIEWIKLKDYSFYLFTFNCHFCKPSLGSESQTRPCLLSLVIKTLCYRGNYRGKPGADRQARRHPSLFFHSYPVCGGPGIVYPHCLHKQKQFTERKPALANIKAEKLVKEGNSLFFKSGIYCVASVLVCTPAQEAHHSMQSPSCQPFCCRQGAYVQWENPTATARVQHRAWRSQCTAPHHFLSTSWGRGRPQGPSLLQQAGAGHLSTTRELIPNLSRSFPRLQVATLPPLSPMPSDSFLHYHWKILSCELICSSRNALEKHIRSSEGRDTQSSGGMTLKMHCLTWILHPPDCSPCHWIYVRIWLYTEGSAEVNVLPYQHPVQHRCL